MQDQTQEADKLEAESIRLKARKRVITLYSESVERVARQQVRLALRGKSETARLKAGQGIVSLLDRPEAGQRGFTVQILNALGMPEVAMLNGKPNLLESHIEEPRVFDEAMRPLELEGSTIGPEDEEVQSS